MEDLTGRVFTWWTVIGRVPNRGTRVIWLCRCRCGIEREVFANGLRNDHTKSCGCYGLSLRLKGLKHGATKTRLYRIWQGMLQRCNNPKTPEYPNYGGRGIRVCDQWATNFEAFRDHIGQPPSAQHSIDRYPNNDGNYEPGNVRWALPVEQLNNRRITRKVKIGDELYSARDLIGPNTVSHRQLSERIAKGWCGPCILGKPLNKRCEHRKENNAAT